MTFRMPSTHSVCDILVVKPKAWRLTSSMVYQKKLSKTNQGQCMFFKVSGFKSNIHHILVIIIGVMLLIY